MDKMKEKLKLFKKSKNIKKVKNDDHLLELIETDQLDILKPILVYKNLDFKRCLYWETHILTEEVNPIHVAATLPNHQLLKLFLDYKCPPDLKTASGLNPLHFVAIYKGCTENVDHLVDDGIDVDAVDKDGKTVVHWACEQKNHKFVKKVVELDLFDLNIKDNRGLTALDIAKNKNVRQTVNLIQAHLKKQNQETFYKNDGNFTLKYQEVLQQNNELVKENRNLRACKHMSMQDVRGATPRFPDRSYQKERSFTRENDNSSKVTGLESNSFLPPFEQQFSRNSSTRQTLACHSSRKATPLQGFSHNRSLSLSAISEYCGINNGMSDKLAQIRQNAIQTHLSKFLDEMKPDIIIVKLVEKKILDVKDYQRANRLKSDREKYTTFYLK